jgi:nitrogen-specific signal transduction histidine kinase/CheY-like chemotaxis protein
VFLGADGEPKRAIGISMDVTARRLLEAQYQQAQKMEAIGRLAGGVAHDFNNLLTAILGYCHILLAELGADDPRREDVNEINKAGVLAAALTRQLLAFSRKQIIEPAILNLNDIVSSMQPMLARLLGEDVNVVLTLAPSLGAVKADRSQVEQIVLNLAVNARDAMPLGGTLMIETADVDFDERYAERNFSVAAGPYVSLVVSDTGVGMTPEVQARLFEPFFTTKEQGKGTGLGLATVHGIVTGAGGVIHAYSEVGRGSTFKIYLPRLDEQPVGGSTSASEREIRGAAQLVLVVDDSEAVRRLVKRILEGLNYRVLTAANAAEAQQTFERHATVDLLVTDVVMPGASGPELTRQLLQSRPALKVIFMSGYTEEAIVRGGVLNAGVAFLGKPFTAEALGQKVKDLLSQ